MKQVKMTGKALVHLRVPFSQEDWMDDEVNPDVHYLEVNLDHFLSKEDLIKWLHSISNQDFYSALMDTSHEEIEIDESIEIGRVPEHPIYDDE